MSNNSNTSKNPVPKNFQGQVITNKRGSSKKPSDEINVLSAVGDGAIGSTKQKYVPKPAKERVVADSSEKVAIHSTKNVYWPGVGKVLKGYNIVKSEQAERWLSKEHIREATPEEVAREFGL
jgi:hypothetical protein